MGLVRETVTNIYRIFNDGKIDKEKGGILFKVEPNSFYDFRKCKNFNLMFLDSFSFNVSSAYYYTGLDKEKYIFVRLSDLNSIPNEKISLICQEEVNVNEFSINGLKFQSVMKYNY